MKVEASCSAQAYKFLFRFVIDQIAVYKAEGCSDEEAITKAEITGVINEPFHYRYIGVQAATEIYNQGICLEEYTPLIHR